LNRFKGIYRKIVSSKTRMAYRDRISKKLLSDLPGNLDAEKLKEVLRIVLGDSYVESNYLAPNVLKGQFLSGLKTVDRGIGCDAMFGKISYAALCKYIRSKKELRENAKIQELIPAFKKATQRRTALMTQVVGGGNVRASKTVSKRRPTRNAPRRSTTIVRNEGLDTNPTTVETAGLKYSQIRFVGDSLTGNKGGVDMGYAKYFKWNGNRISNKRRGKMWGYERRRGPDGKKRLMKVRIDDYAYYQGARNTRQVIYRMKKERNNGSLDKLKVIASLTGTNDIYVSESVKYNQRPIEQDPLVKKLRTLWGIFLGKRIKLFVFTIPPQGRFLRYWFRRLPKQRRDKVILACKERIKRVNAWIKAQASANIKVIDLYAEVVDPDKDGYIKKKYDRDGIHFNKDGAMRMAGMLKDMIRTGKHKGMDTY
jgi:hypothetical protein